MLLVPCIFIALWASSVQALHYAGPFQTGHWNFLPDKPIQRVKFIVALKLRNTEKMHDHFLSVSDPKSSAYGKFLSPQELHEHYGPTAESMRAVKEHFKKLPNVELNIGEHGDLLEVVAHAKDVEALFKTELGLVENPSHKAKAIRAKTPLFLPDHVAESIDFVSLNAPVTHVHASAYNAKAAMEQKSVDSFVNVVPGSGEARIYFTPTCGDGILNYMNPPCANLTSDQVPLFTLSVNEYSDAKTNPRILNTNPTVFHVPANAVYCYNYLTGNACSNITDQATCRCVTKVSSNG